MIIWIYCVVLISAVCTVLATPNKYANKFELHAEGGMEVALHLARKYDCRVLGTVGSLSDHYVLERNQLERNGKKKVSYSTRNTELEKALMSESGVKNMEQQTFTNRVKRDLTFNDPSYASMWYVNDENWNLNVTAAWENGWTGQGIVIAVVDDGLEITHTDLFANYDSYASYDYVSYDENPSPGSKDDSHGTSCAGEIAAIANNSECIVGIAYKSRIGGIRILDPLTTGLDEAGALSHEPQYIDIYSNSWGPRDDGNTFGGPSSSVISTLKKGVTKGRGGKGSIYVWAAGNGGDVDDACGSDGYVNSIETIAITAVTSNGKQAYYGEQCSAIMAATLSGGDFNIGDKYIPTTGLKNGCVNDFSGTSAAAPLASGIIALTLQANNNLSWRDVQHIIAETAVSETLTDGEWFVNGVGHNVSHKYGFGLMNAATMVELALKWKAVTSQIDRTYTVALSKYLSGTGIVHKEYIEVSRIENGMNLTALEHVVVILTMEHYNINGIEISLMSPMMTNSIVLHTRRRTIKYLRLTNWPFMSVHFWGEAAEGIWIVLIRNKGPLYYNGKVWKIQLKLYGTGHEAETTTESEIETTTETRIETSAVPDTTESVNYTLIISIVTPILVVMCVISFGAICYLVKKKWNTKQ